MTTFNDLGLHPQVVEAVLERGYETPTPIQEGVIPLLLEGKDIIGQAQTGTGKTAAFSLPLLHNIDPGSGHVQALVLAPTRELAMQVSRIMSEYGRTRRIRVLTVYGGASYSQQLRGLRRGADVVVGTPGRLIDLIERKALDLSNIDNLVLDEADEMLSMGFVEDIEKILDKTPETRQTALFSATMPTPIRRLADKYMNDPQSVTIKNKQLTVSAIEQRYYLVNHEDKTAALTRLFEVEDITTGLIFARTRVGTGELSAELTGRGFPAEALNGDLNQEARERVLKRFRSGQIKVLVATDVAARGLDIDNISHVFNFDLPGDSESYVHRVGRTGRAGKTGIAISLVTPKERWRLRRIESYTRQKMTEAQIPTEQEIQTRRQAELIERMMVWLRRGRCTREKEMVAELVEEGYDAIEIAASALKLARAEEKQRPIYPVRKVSMQEQRGRGNNNSKRGRRRDNRDRTNGNNGNGRFDKSGRQEQGMVRLTLSAGKKDGVRVNDVVGSIAYHADIPGRALGAIRIQEQQTFIDVPEQMVSQVLDKAGNYKLRRMPVTLTKA